LTRKPGDLCVRAIATSLTVAAAALKALIAGGSAHYPRRSSMIERLTTP
jgi:hypothetical protein